MTWRFITWTLLATTAGWFIVTGFWTLGLAQRAADVWIGEPRAVPFVPFFDTDTLVTPFAPFHALFVHGNWLPILSFFVCGWGTISLWWLTKKSAAKAYPRDSS